MFTTEQIIDIAKLSQALANNDIAKSALFGRRLDPLLPVKIYCVRKDVEWLYNLNPNNTDYFPLTSNFLYALCESYGLRAWAIISGAVTGTTVTPLTPSLISGGGAEWIQVRKADFANATDYEDDRLMGKSLSVDGNWIPRILTPTVEWEALPSGGVQILFPGFDSSSSEFGDNDIIIRILVNAEISDGVNPSTFAYNLSAITVIPNLASGTDYQVRTVIITPNGYDYDWGSDFIFSDNWPKQPLCNGVGTRQIYQFQYVPGIGDVCMGQSLNVTV